MKQGRKIIWRNLKHDPVSLGLTVTPLFPGHHVVGPALHLYKNKRSRNVARVMIRKLFDRSKPSIVAHA